MSTAENQIERPQLKAEPMKSLKERILAAPRGEPVPVDMRRFPEWPQDLYVRPPTGASIAAWEQGGIEYGKKGKITIKHSPTRKAELIQMTLCQQDGSLIFGRAEAGEIAKLDARVVNHLFAAARKVAGQDVDDDENEGDEEGN